MKKFFFLIAIIASVWQGAAAQDADTVWTKSLWQLGSKIWKVQFTPDEKSVAVAIGNGVYVYDIETSELIKQFRGQIVGVIDFVFTDDGKQIITTSADHIPRVWEYETTDSIRILSGFTWLWQMSFIDKSTIVGAIGGVDNDNIRVIDYKTGEIIDRASCPGSVSALAVNKEKKLLAVGSIYNSEPKFYDVLLYDLWTLDYICKLGTHNDDITDLSFSPDGKYLASSSLDGTVKVWDVDERSLKETIIHSPVGTISLNVKFSPNGNKIITSGGGGLDFITKIWDSNTFNLIHQYPTPFGSAGGLDVSIDSNYIAIGNAHVISILKAHWDISGLVEPKEEIGILYPNPVGTIITVPNEKELQIKQINIINSIGKQIKTILSPISILNKVNIDISELDTGAYYLIVEYPKLVKTYKFIKN